MLNFSATQSSQSFAPTFAPALFFIAATMAPPTQAVEIGSLQSRSYLEAGKTASSFRGASNFQTNPARSFEERITDFYSKLSASQRDFDADIQKILLSNLASLYED